jgi:hypothetical protein
MVFTLVLVIFGTGGIIAFCNYRYWRVFGFPLRHMALLDEYKKYMSPKKVRRYRVVLATALIILICCFAWP